MSETIDETKNKLISLLIKSLPCTNIGLKELLNNGDRVISHISESQKQNRETFFYNLLTNRQKADFHSNNAYFKKYLMYKDDEHGDVYWFLEALKKLGNLGSLLMGFAFSDKSEQEDSLDQEESELVKTAIIDQINNKKIDGLGFISFDVLKQIGAEFQDQLPEGVRDNLYEAFDYQAGVRIIGLIILKEVRVLFDAFEKRAEELQDDDFARSGICFKKPVISGSVNVNDLLLLSDLYVRIYNILAKNLPEKTEQASDNLKREMFEKVARVPWSGYMDVFRNNLGDGNFESLIPSDIRSQAYMTDRERIQGEYQKCANIEQESAFFKKYCVDHFGGRLPSPNNILAVIWGTNDYMLLEETFADKPKQLLSYYIAKIHKEIGRVYEDCIQLTRPESVSEFPKFSISPSVKDKTPLYRAVFSAGLVWDDIQKKKEMSDLIPPFKVVNPIGFAYGVSFQDAVYITLARFFVIDRNVVGEYQYKGKPLTIRPERFLNRRSHERSIDAVTPDTLKKEQEEENKGQGLYLRNKLNS